MILLLISFIAGILTVLAPCILPLLPVIVGGSFTGNINTKKTLTIIVSLGASVLAFTFLLKVSTLFITIPESTWKYVSGGIILALGIVTLFPSLWENKFLARLARKSNALMNTGDQKQSFWGDVIVGASLGPVFTTCSPTYFIVLATVLPVQPIIGIVYLLSYTIGLCISLFCIALLGQKIIGKLGIVADSKGWFKKVLGIIFIIVGFGILSGADKVLQNKLVTAGFFDITKVEQSLLAKNMADMKNGKIYTGGIGTETPAPELSTIDGYINTDGKPITLKELRGKVVLLDIWTYSCINCQRTIPYLNDWYAKYKDKGLVIVGLHTPEFAFEKVQANVEKAVQEFGIQYPVVLDNDYSTWNALGNQYWPRKYLINTEGNIIYDHIGEGGYEETEKEIRKALGITDDAEDLSTQTVTPVAIETNSPETYFGASRNTTLANGVPKVAGAQKLSQPQKIYRNELYLTGTWNFSPEYAENTDAAEIIFAYDAKNVFITAGSDKGVEIEVYQDDVFVKKITVQQEQLYTLIEGKNMEKHTLKIKIPKAGLQAFTFTFG